MTAEKQTQPVTKMVKFKLSHPHTHAGVDRQPGDIITLRSDQADRLLRETPPRGEVAS